VRRQSQLRAGWVCYRSLALAISMERSLLAIIFALSAAAA
jgi:hypothetical protein